MHAPRRVLVTEEEFLALPESVFKTELIDGEVIVSPAPSPHHQEILRRLMRALEQWADGQAQRPTILFAPVDIRFQKGRILQPDLAVWITPIALPETGPIERVPDICAEVLSSDRVHDRVTKRMIYAASGVREYWVVERHGPIERWTGDALDQAEELDDRLTSTLLPGFDVGLSELLPA